MTTTTPETTETTTGYALIDTVVETPWTNPDGTPFPSREVFDIYLTGYSDTAPGGRTPEDKIGTIVSVRMATYERNGFTTIDDIAEGVGQTYVKGARINPTPEHGKFYRSLAPLTGTMEAPHGLLYQYIDGDHLDDRNNRWASYNVIAGPEGKPWVFPNDSSSTLPEPYIEVQAPEGEVAAEAEAEVSGDRYVAASLAFGKAASAGGDQIVVNPEPVIGQDYVTWLVSDANDRHRTVYHGTVIGEQDGNKVLALCGYWYGTTDTHSYDTTTTTFTLNDTCQWAELALVEPERTGDDAVKAALRTQLIDLRESFEAFNEALNEKADEKSWCPEYEEVLERLDGMEGRNGNNPRRDWDVWVSVTFTGEIDSPSARVDDQVDDSHFDSDMESFQMSSMSYSATGTVRVTVESVPDPESNSDMADYINDDMVEGAIESAGGSGISVDDWSVDRYEES